MWNKIIHQAQKVLMKKQNFKRKEGKSKAKILLMPKIDVLKKIDNLPKSLG